MDAPAGLATELEVNASDNNAAQASHNRLRMIELAKKSKYGGTYGWHARKMAIVSSGGMCE